MVARRSLEAADDEAEATPERLELLAVVRGLEALDQPSRVTLVTGSRFLCWGRTLAYRSGAKTTGSGGLRPDDCGEKRGLMAASGSLARLSHTGMPPVTAGEWRTTSPPSASNPPLPAKRSGRSIRIDAPHAATKQQISNHKSQPISKGPRRNDAKSKFRPAQNSVNLNLLGHWSVVIGHWLSSLAHRLHFTRQGALTVRTTVSLEGMNALLEGRLGRPADVLGPQTVHHEGRKMLAVRAFLPDTRAGLGPRPQAWHSRPMRRIHPAGLYEALWPLDSRNIVTDSAPMPTYQLRAIDHEGEMKTLHDPYAFAPLMTDFDLHLFGEGKLLRAYDKLGAQLREVDGVRGTNFAVWAPNARSVSIVGDFNHWDGRRHPMKLHATGGVWELFVPGMDAGEKYKYRVRGAVRRNDRQERSLRLRGRVAAVHGLHRHGPESLSLARRRVDGPPGAHQSARKADLASMRCIWEAGGAAANRHHGWLNYRELAHQLVAYCQEMGYTHIELLPVSEHPYSGSLGLSDRRLFRRHQPLRHAARTLRTSSITAIDTASA